MQQDPQHDEASPILGSWRRVYLLVIGVLAAVIAALYVFTKIYQ